MKLIRVKGGRETSFYPESDLFVKAGLLTSFQIAPSRKSSGVSDRYSKVTAAGTVWDLHPIPS